MFVVYGVAGVVMALLISWLAHSTINGIEVLPMALSWLRCYAAGWCSYGGVVGGACCKLAHSTINGIEVLPACALMMA